MIDFESQFTAARRVSTPLVAVRTFDAMSTIASVKRVLEPVITDTPMIQWDAVTGLSVVNGFMTQAGHTPINLVSKDTLVDMLGGMDNQPLSHDLTVALGMAHNAAQDAVIFIQNAHLFWSEPLPIQAIWNLRDVFKARGNMLVLLCSSGAVLPAELASDVLVMDEPLPTSEQLGQIVIDAHTYAGWPAPSETIVSQATSALIGLPAFPAEQAVAMSQNMDTQTLEVLDLWERKRQAINATPGLRVWNGKETLEDVGGLDTIKAFLTSIMNGKESPRCIVIMDEIEKAFGGSGSDSSGVKQELTGDFLSWSENGKVRGILALGVPGAGKTTVAKAIGRTYGIPVILFNLAATQHHHVGVSGAQLRTALATLDAISGGRILMLGTCNSMAALTPEIQARFGLGKFFFDVPTESERASIWTVHRKAYDISEQPKGDYVPDAGWTGREIHECCMKADMLGMTLLESSKYIVPVTVSSRDVIESLRANSSGKYLSASYAGLYDHSGPVHSTPVPNTATPVVSRKMRAQ